MTYKDLYQLVHNFYKNRPYPNEGRFLLEDLTGLSFPSMYVHFNDQVDPSLYTYLKKILHKRDQGWPLAYIINKRSFYGRNFYVNQDVLIPRLETEFSIEAMLDIKATSFLELGVGSGAVSITMKLERPCLEVAGVDISRKALAVANKNARSHGAHVNFFYSDLFDKVEGTYDLIYSNPPYIENNQLGQLEREVKDHEPLLALDGGEDGLDFYRRIIKELPTYLNPQGHVVFEIGASQKTQVLHLLEEENFKGTCIQDYGGLDRVIIARRRIECTKNCPSLKID